MTAYGAGRALSASGLLVVEIQSVNRRYLEVSLALPRVVAPWEGRIRKAIGERVGRGMVTLSAQWRPNPQRALRVTPHVALARALQEGWQQIAEGLGREAKEVTLSLLAQGADLFAYEEEGVEDLEALLDKAVEEALTQLVERKCLEGSLLTRDLAQRAAQLSGQLSTIAARAPFVAEAYRAKLAGRLADFSLESSEKEERLLREIATYAERIDITEEIVRAESHLQQLQQLLAPSTWKVGDPGGKMMDFLLQELHREATTMGSKASDLAITQAVVGIKSEIEKMKEQVQNLE